MKMVENICPEKKQEFANVCLARNTVRYVAEISSLAEEFRQRFPDFAAIEKELMLFSSPFSVDPDDATEHLQLELIELQCDAVSESAPTAPSH
ncbi:general transcription factor II-I repeat domain-containing protein 2B-like [Tachysurus ichikawai]